MVVNAGLKLKKNQNLTGRCDSFVVKTHVHYPTDINLLFDAIRKVITLTASYADREQLDGWRQQRHHVKKIKRAYRASQQCKRSTSTCEKKKQQQKNVIANKHQAYLDLSTEIIRKSQATLKEERSSIQMVSAIKALEIRDFINHAIRQISQIERRVIQGEKIPHEEKVFSLFQPHTEWINKGKAGVPVELGLRVCIMESSEGFILHHKVMQQEVDNQVAVELVGETQEKHPEFNGCSFDKGFHSPENQEVLGKMLDKLVLPKKGRCNKSEREVESSPEFRETKRKHSAVESGINALEVHGLDKCPDHGITGFKRYVAMAIVARNIQKLGAELIKQTRAQEKRERDRHKLTLAA